MAATAGERPVLRSVISSSVPTMMLIAAGITKHCRNDIRASHTQAIAARQQCLGQRPSEAGGRAGDEPAFGHVKLTLLVNRLRGGIY